MLSTHEVVVAGGTFRVLLTPMQRVVAVLDVDDSPLGPLHVALNVDRSPRLDPNVAPALLYASEDYGPEVRRAVWNASTRTFHAASSVARSIAGPAIGLTRDAAEDAAGLAMRLESPSPAHHHAAHLLLRVRLGDIHARSMVEGIVRDARAGVSSARRVADTLKHASQFLAKVVDVPVSLAAQIRGVGGPGSALAQFHEVLDGVKRGDFRGVEKLVQAHLGELQGALSNVPGIGAGLSAGLGAGMAALAGDHPIEVAVKAAYAAMQSNIPPEIRHATSVALGSVLAFIEQPHSLTDASIQAARDQLPMGTPRDVYDTLVRILVKHVPVQQEVAGLANHYLSKYAPTLALAGAAGGRDVARALAADPSLVQRAPANLLTFGDGAPARTLPQAMTA